MKDRKEYSKEYYIRNKVRIKEYRLQSQDSIKEYQKRYIEENKEKIREYRKNYRLQNNDKVYQKNYRVNRKKTDDCFRTACNLRTRLKMAILSKKTRKGNKTLDYLGCTIKELLTYLGDRRCRYCESTNKIQIDHIYPMSKIDLSVEENIYKIMHYTNLQYLCRECNTRKGDKIT